MESHTPSNFIEQIIEQDIKIGKNKGRVHTRFPPEPNGHLHIGHAKSICLNFGIARKYNGYCNLRFDDTNPEKESAEYVEAIKDYVRWLGFERHMCCYASDYFKQFYYYAVQLIEKKLAYVCSLSAEEIRHCRGTLTEAGTESPYRERSISENLTLFEKMRNGVYEKRRISICAIQLFIEYKTLSIAELEENGIFIRLTIFRIAYPML